MAELSNIGKHCGWAHCNVKSFLPSRCKGCKVEFCREHLGFRAHECQHAPSEHQVPVCPVCGQPVALKNFGESPDAAVSRHLEARGECGGGKKSSVPPCAAKGCRYDKVHRVQCSRCRRSFCPSHRHHGCEAWESAGRDASHARASQHAGGASSPWAGLTERARATVDAFARKFARKNPQRARQQHMMLLKQRAKGDSKIPEQERFYAEVVLPFDSGKSPVYMFFSCRWSVGKALDKICAANQIKNANGKLPSREHPEYLCLWDMRDGSQLPFGAKLQDLGAKSGSVVLLERIRQVQQAD